MLESLMQSLRRPWLLMTAGLAPLFVSFAVAGTIEQRAEPRPSFRMTPLVFQSNARAGQEVRFEFTLEAFDTPLDVLISPIGLQQNKAGLVLPDGEASSPGTIRLLTNPRVRLQPGEQAQIRGAWQLPTIASDFFMAGLLVTDQGVILPAATSADGKPQVGGSLRFVTRYLLRLEANCRSRVGVPTLSVEQGELIEKAGAAWASCWLNTLDTGSVRTEIRARLLDSAGNSICSPFPLFLPVRQNQTDKVRRQVHVLSGSRVQIAAPVPAPLFPGEYELEIFFARSPASEHCWRFPLHVGVRDFPAQRSVVAEVVKSLEVSPRRIELSTLRGGRRLAPLAFHNRGQQAVAIRILRVDENEWLTVRPSEFTLEPKRRRNVLLAVKGGARLNQDHYSKLIVQVAPTENSLGGEIELPIALTASKTSTALFECSSPRFERTDKTGWVVLPVENQGSRHAAIHATLVFSDEENRQRRVIAGHGRWLFPGNKDELRFRVPLLPEGNHPLQVEITDGAHSLLKFEATLQVK